MNSASPPRAYPPRLNPFAFPSDTTFRFILLIVAVLGASLFIYNSLFLRFNGEAFMQVFRECYSAIELPTAADAGSVDYTDRLDAAMDARFQCLAPIEQREAIWMLAGAGLLLCLAGALYWVFPLWYIWHAHLVPLNAEDAPEAVAYLGDLCRETGLYHPPRFVWNPLNTASSGLAFGRFRRYYVALSGGLVTQFYSDQPAFRAIVLHELAHLRNADIDKTYFTLAVWWAFVVAALAPEAAFLVGLTTPDALNFSWRLLALAVLVYLTRNAILRAREVYADVRASTWDGPAGALARTLATLPHPPGGRWRAALRMHPDPRERQQALIRPDRLFRLGFWDALGVGIVSAMAFEDVRMLLSFLIGPSSLSTLGAGLIFGILIIGVIGFGAWRATFAALIRGRASRGIGRAGLGLGLGALLGRTLALPSAFEGATSLPILNDSVVVFGLEALWAGLVLASLFLFLRWVAAGASTWLETALSSRWPRTICILGVTFAGGVLAVWLWLIVSTHDPFLALLALESDSLDALLGIAIYLLTQPLILPVLIVLWAFPLAAWFWQRRFVSQSAPSWALLDPSPPFMLLPQAPLRPRLALSVGAIGSVPFFGLLLLVWIIRRWGISEAVRGSDQAILLFYYGQILVAGLFQAIIAAVVASLVRRLGALHGLFAAFVAGCLMVVAILGLNLAFGGTIDLGFAWQTYAFVVNGGALLALVFAPFVAALAGWVRRARGASGRWDVTDAALLDQLLMEPSPLVTGRIGAAKRSVHGDTL